MALAVLAALALCLGSSGCCTVYVATLDKTGTAFRLQTAQVDDAGGIVVRGELRRTWGRDYWVAYHLRSLGPRSLSLSPSQVSAEFARTVAARATYAKETKRLLFLTVRFPDRRWMPRTYIDPKAWVLQPDDQEHYRNDAKPVRASPTGPAPVPFEDNGYAVLPYTFENAPWRVHLQSDSLRSERQIPGTKAQPLWARTTRAVLFVPALALDVVTFPFQCYLLFSTLSRL